MGDADALTLLKFHSWLRESDGAQIDELNKRPGGETVLSVTLTRDVAKTAMADLPFVEDVREDPIGPMSRARRRRIMVDLSRS